MPHRLDRRRHRSGLAVVTATALVAVAAAVAMPPLASAAPDPGSPVKVNQVAYVPGVTKQATVVSSAGAPIAWTLRNAAGSTVASGQSTVRGADPLSGDSVHIIDFSSYDTAGSGYVLSAAGANSHPFDISAEPVRRLRYESLAFFYHQRSGTPILSQYVGSQYARPAGHLNVAPNQGDTNVACRTACGYNLDVRGGWYDAGDHGKYVVNGGISTWQLFNIYDRAVNVAGADPGALRDGTLAIPERSNGVPDVLDEARWEVEFLLRMQVPDGRPNAGMVHHKIHDENWTGLPTRPEADAQRRLLSPVSTAATLNMAAVAAQAARLFRPFDAAFSTRALAAAQRAYAAAKANPVRLATLADATGGGAYEDNSVTDEFYWAAAELFVATGSAAYRADLTGSSLYRGASFTTRGYDWNWVGGLGDTTLALVPNGLPVADVAAIRSRIVGFADARLAEMANQGYPAPLLAPTAYWGSNGTVANNANVIALAFDFTGQQKYRTGVFQTLDYLFGRNPLNQSYVSGYGEKAVRNVHHRFWANQVNGSLPIVPPGVLSGGPNHEIQDPYAQSQLAGCRAQKCFIDHIDAYSVNEVTINWNSAFAWLTNWAAEKVGAAPVADTTAPSTPGAPTASTVGAGSVTLSWPASADPESGVAGYDVLRVNGSTATVVANPTGTSVTVTGLTANTAYTFAVVARNGAGLASARSASVAVTTAGGSTEPPVGACRVSYSANTWNTGFGGSITLTNTGASAWSAWTLTFGFAGNQRLTQGWGGRWSQTGSTVTFTNEAHNGAVPAGGSVTVGFNASYSGTNTNPTTFAANGTTCT